MKNFSLILTTALLLTIFVAGCSSGPVNVPIGKRPAGQDITPEERADKKGDAPQPGK